MSEKQLLEVQPVGIVTSDDGVSLGQVSVDEVFTGVFAEVEDDRGSQTGSSPNLMTNSDDEIAYECIKSRSNLSRESVKGKELDKTQVEVLAVCR